jgi:MazG family protein
VSRRGKEKPVAGKRSARQAAKTGQAAQIKVSARDAKAGEWFAKLVALQERLCAPGGCPWDREQSHASLRKYLLEETYEVLDAMNSGDAADFAGELGDLLLQIVFHSVLAESAGTFTPSDVIEAIYTKMIRRHPHVFGDAAAETSRAVLKQWEEVKAQERAEKRGGPGSQTPHNEESVLSGVPRSLPGVLEAYQLTRRASHIGFDWENLQGVFDKLDEEMRELATLTTGPALTTGPDKPKSSPSVSPRIEEEVGDLLFAAVNVARFVGADPEIALKKANLKFKHRFQWMEAAAGRENRKLADVPRERMEDLWNEAKKAAPRL